MSPCLPASFPYPITSSMAPSTLSDLLEAPGSDSGRRGTSGSRSSAAISSVTLNKSSYIFTFKNVCFKGASKMTQQWKALATKLGNLSSIPLSPQDGWREIISTFLSSDHTVKTGPGAQMLSGMRRPFSTQFKYHVCHDMNTHWVQAYKHTYTHHKCLKRIFLI